MSDSVEQEAIQRVSIDRDEVLIRAEHVSKKFCRSLKRSLWYGAKDVAEALLPWKQSSGNVQGSGHGGDSLPPLRKDEFWAVQDVSFEVKRGECLGLIGHNGAGKSTLLKMLYGVNRPDAGCITTRGKIGALIELSAGFNPILTGRENVYNRGAVLGFSAKEIDRRFDEIVAFSELEEFMDMPVQNYSSGMTVRLGFAVSVQMRPDILILDEVLAVGDAAFRYKCLQEIARIRDNAATIFVTHSMPQVHRICTSVMFMEAGIPKYLSSNVGEGIKQYFQTLNFDTKSNVGTELFGVEKLMFQKSENDDLSTDSITLKYGESLTLEIHLAALGKITEASLKLTIWNAELLPVMEVLSQSMQHFPICFEKDGKSKIKVQLESLQLNSGRYFISIILTEKNSRNVLAIFDDIGSIVMESSYVSAAPLICQGSFTSK
ncbi:polysaccharide ABC transporter ATP-binding protein [Pseudomonadota bacterium]